MDFNAAIYNFFYLKNQNGKFPIGRFFIDHGQVMEPVLRGEEFLLEKDYHDLDVYDEQGRCFDNAQKMMMNDIQRYAYCEGIICIPEFRFSIDHAWVYDKEKDWFFDPTLRLPRNIQCTYIGLVIPISVYLKCQQNWKGSILDTLWRGLEMGEDEIQQTWKSLLSENAEE